MAGRPTKAGLDYVPFDTDMEQDKKIKLLEAKHPKDGWMFWTKLLLRLYRDRGYFFEASEDNLLLLSKEINVDINSINVYINTCLQLGLFNRPLFDRFRILTSNRIQITYLHATHRRTRINFIKEFLLLSLDEVKECNTRLHFLIYVDINSIFEDNNLISDYINKAQASFSFTILYKEYIKGIRENQQQNGQEPEDQPGSKNDTTYGSKKQLMSTEMQLKWTEWKQDVFKSEQWLYTTQRNFGLTEEGLKEALEKFFKYLQDVDDMKDASLMKKHFVNWYPRRQQRDQDELEKNISKTAGIAKDASHYRDGWEDPK